ncbi:filamentous hemagglutinin family protein [Microbacteriaceae bacterium K1510]|nr:filamentous hemagglutinin family protein [Microbacteriaceae bacterium K1510]
MLSHTMKSLAVQSHRRALHSFLLAGVSALALVSGSPAAMARPLGGPSMSPSAAALAASQAAAQQSAAQATSALKRATQAIQAMQATQAAARAAAASASHSATLPLVNVPNGLGAGGLQVGPGTWQGANAPTQSVANGQTNVGVNQTAPQAILSWTTFNVGAQTTLTFDQHGNSNWVALNRVTGNLGPSQILGQIKADGQVYIINQNGIVFGGASQVNVGALIASSANITDQQFLTKGIYSTQSGTTYAPSFTGAAGKIVVEKGALITTNDPSSLTSGGGFVLMMGSAVENAGTIQTPSGQAQLAAGDNFVLRPGYGTDTNQLSTTRGNEIATLFNAGSSSGSVINSGLIFSQQGDITLAGRTITQSGVLLSSTSVNQRGTIHLLNSASDASGSVTLGADSITTILPELDSADTALNSQRDALIASAGNNALARGQFDNLSVLADRPDQSRVEIVTGGTAVFRSGSLTMAQGGQVSVSAGKRVFAESGATIDVSGTTGTLLPMSANNILVNVQGNELRDSPYNRDSGNLKSANVWIDVRDLVLVPAGTGGYTSDRYYTPGGLLEVAGYLNNTGHTIGEWTAVGGTITLAAPEVIAQQGSVFNISGGSVTYQSGYILTTNFVGADGRIYNIDNASGSMLYDGIAGGFTRKNARWNISQTWTNPLAKGGVSVRWEDGYTIGRDAGQLILSTPTSIFEGDILADVITGTRQTGARASGVTDGYKFSQNTAPLPGTLALGQYNGYGLAGGYNSDVKFGSVAAITAGMNATTALPSDRANTAWFDAGLIDSYGLGGVSVATGKQIFVEAPLVFANGGQVKLVAPIVDIKADITARSGGVTISNILKAATGTVAFTTPDGGAQLTLEPGVTIDTRGLWVNALANLNDLPGLAFLSGGNVTFDSTQNVTLAEGSVIDVSSGGAILANGKTQGGKGGNVTIKAGDAQQNGGTGEGTLILGGRIRAYGVTGGGTLTVSSPGNIVIGDNAELAGGTLAAGTPAPVALTLKQTLTIPAGTPLPFTLIENYTALAYDVPTLVDVTINAAPSGPTGADWTVPQGMDALQSRDGNGSTQYWSPGNVIPAGTIITGWSGNGRIPAGTVIPSSVFLSGIPVNPYQVIYAAGSVLATSKTYAVGAVIPAGTVLSQTIAVAPAPALNSSFFTAGFANYDINGGQGVLVANNSAVAPAMPVYRFSADSYAVRSGGDPSSAMSLWTPPLFIENPISASLTQRGGASLTLRSQSTVFNGASIGGGSIMVGEGASITVDPGQSITLNAFGQLTVLGDLTAHGGSITLANVADGSKVDAGRNFDAQGNGRGVSIWVDALARLDVSGLAYGASDSVGRPYGKAADGGTIAINGGGAFVLIRPGAELDADGALVPIDLAAGRSARSPSQPLAWATNGGSIALSSSSGLYLDGDMHAVAGGANASGGSLSISLVTPSFVTQSFPNSVPPANVLVPSTLVVTQAYQPSSLPSDIAPGTNASALQFGHAAISVDKIKAGDFDSLTLKSGDFMQFSGDVSLSLGRSLTLTAAAFTAGNPFTGDITSAPSIATNSVKLSAPYILFTEPQAVVPDGSSSGSVHNPNGSGALTAATFEADANQIDIQGLVQFGASVGVYDSTTYQYIYTNYPSFLTTRFKSQGDIRFLSIAGVVKTQLATDWNLELLAAQIYPATNTFATVIAGQKLTLGRTTDTIPDAPFSLFGTLSLTAPIVEQGGVVRAPFGLIMLGSNSQPLTQRVDLLPGSLTSVSMDGLDIPYGGTIDGVTYNYNGAAVKPLALTNAGTYGAQSGIVLDGQAVNVASGAVLDMSGGGTLSGAGFVSGRGGSVNVLNTPLVNANPTTPLSKASDKVYAIVPGYRSGYAPVAPENGAGDPLIGQQITVPSGVPGLPAGTYTLLPSNYALLPGAYRVELGGTTMLPVAGAIGNGTYATSVYTGFANTAISSSLPVTALITSGTSVRSYSQYNEQSYSDFLIANTAQFGGVRPLLPADGKALLLTFEAPTSPTTGSALTFDGTVLFQGSQGGSAGQASLAKVDEIYADPSTAAFTGVAVDAASINALKAPRLFVNGSTIFNNGTILFQGGRDIAVRDGVTLRAGEIFLVGGNISVGNNVTLTTIGQGTGPFDSASTGMAYNTSYGVSVLALSNGELNFLGSQGTGAITVGANSQLYAEGTLAFATNGVSSLDASAHFGARNIALAVGTLNIGDAATIAAAGAPAGFLFNQTLFNLLVNGDPLHGAPALEKITLSAANAINVFGNSGLDATGTGINLVLNTSAIYGYGSSGDHATIAAGKITWNGIPGATPPAIAAGGPGTGAGTLSLVADEIDFGQFVSLDTTSASRVIYGFGNVNITGRTQIVSAGNSKLFVYQAPSTDPAAVFGQSGTGGNLTLTTPLLTGVRKSIMAYTAGGALNVVAPAGIAPSAATSTVAGAEIDLTGDSVAIASTVLLPSGKFVVNATNDIVLNDGSRIDLSGRPSTIQKATVYGFGGIAIFNSAQGAVTQAAGSVIDVSATNANAGSVTIDARNGAVAMGGAVKGTANDGFVSGDFSVAAGTLGDFAGLNALLTQGGFFDARSFDIKTGDLTIGDGVKAHNVTVSVDSGSLTVNGRIDASGAAPGTIRLSAGNGLTLASSAVLDAHGTLLQVDSYGQPIEAKNRGHIELTAAGGTLTLSPGATMDLTAPNGVAYGDVQLNAQRTGETSGDIAINASGPLNIRGAYSIALNAFWTYDLPGGSTITQATLDGYDIASTAFINAALGNADLSARVAGLSAYGSAYHLRPGVQITSSGDLSTSGDIDLAKYRYGAGADRDPNSATYGAGEPMALVVRAAGNVTVNGSISDGFKSSPGVPAVYDLVDVTNSSFFRLTTTNPGGPYTYYLDDSKDVTVVDAWTIPNDGFYIWWTSWWWGPYVDNNGTQYNPGDTIPAGTVLSINNSSGLGFELSNMPNLAVVTSPAIPGAAGTMPAASMLAPGSLSASIRLVSGADLAAADQRALQTTRALNGSGNLTLSDPAYNSSRNGTYFSVLRTGTGNLDLLAGGSFSEATPYGVYTAGTQSAAVLAADGSNPYDRVGATSGGNSHAWYPEHGGDILLMAQQNVTGNIQIANNVRFVDSDLTGNWFGRQGGGSSADPTAWWINFGSYAKTASDRDTLQLVGFQGIGTLGGGNLTVVAGGNAGVSGGGSTSTGLDLAVASTGRVLSDGTLVQTGGGDLVLKVGGVLNSLPAAGATSFSPDYFGSVTDLRGNIVVSTGSVGTLDQNAYGKSWTSYDPRAVDPTAFARSLKTPGPIFTPGDGSVSISTRGDLVFGGASDAGMNASVNQNGMPYTVRNADGTTTLVTSGGQSSFMLWTPATAISLYAAGGDAAVLDGNTVGTSGANRAYPGTLLVAAANGDIRFAEPGIGSLTFAPIELLPSPTGQLELLAAGSIYGTSQVIGMSGADMITLATPFRPVFSVHNDSNASANAAFRFDPYNPTAFGPDTPQTNLHAGDNKPALVYAGVDIVDLTLGQVQTLTPTFSLGFQPSPTTWYLAAKPFEVIAGRDIVGTGPTPSVFLNVNASDVTSLQAGRDIFYQSVTVLGPGVLQVQAGRNLYQGYYGALVSAGDVVNPANNKGGAGITVLAGVGVNGPDYAAFAKLYFDPANQLAEGTPLADSGKVVHAYDQELLSWLRDRFGYAGAAADALAFFLALPKEQQGVFVREVYYQELTLGGREYNNSESPRYQSYLRGRQAIAMLFPDQDAQGAPVTYAGKITMFSGLAKDALGNFYVSDAGVRTQFGGDIQILNPGGQTIVGVEGVTPGAYAGLLTQGQNSNIDVYSLGSVLLGQSRIMTTFGGDILVWSAEGDINAGRGSKTTTIFTPPQRRYGLYGNITIAPSAPASGAGIATLNTIRGTRASNVDLIAPLGTIDAGEAGIRVSGNVNLAALQVLNAANIQVQGTATGIPTVQVPNVAGALTANNAAGSAQQTATPQQGSGAAQPSVIIVEVLGFGGDDGAPARKPEDDQRRGAPERHTYNPNANVQVLGYSTLSDSEMIGLTEEEKQAIRH